MRGASAVALVRACRFSVELAATRWPFTARAIRGLTAPGSPRRVWEATATPGRTLATSIPVFTGNLYSFTISCRYSANWRPEGCSVSSVYAGEVSSVTAFRSSSPNAFPVNDGEMNRISFGQRRKLAPTSCRSSIVNRLIPSVFST